MRADAVAGARWVRGRVATEEVSVWEEESWAGGAVGGEVSDRLKMTARM